MPRDIALIVESLVPNADYRRAGSYAELSATWQDARPIPTEQEIIAAEAATVSAKATIAADPTIDEILDALLVINSDAALNSIKGRRAAAKAARGG